MSNNKRKIQEYNNARNDGMEFALRIVEEKGIDALTNSCFKRNVFGCNDEI